MGASQIPLVAGVISFAGANIDDNIMAIGGISLIIMVAYIFGPFESQDLLSLTMMAISAIAALAGYEIGKRQV